MVVSLLHSAPVLLCCLVSLLIGTKPVFSVPTILAVGLLAVWAERKESSPVHPACVVRVIHCFPATPLVAVLKPLLSVTLLSLWFLGCPIFLDGCGWLVPRAIRYSWSWSFSGILQIASSCSCINSTAC